MRKPLLLPVLLLCVAGLYLAFAVSASAELKYKTYANARFEFSVEYPDIFWGYRESARADFAEFSSANGHFELDAWGMFNNESKNAAKYLKERLNEVSNFVSGSEKSGDGWYTLTYGDDAGVNGVEHHFFEYGLVTPNSIAAVTFKYPAEMSSACAEIIKHLKASLRFGEAKSAESGLVQLREWEPEFVLSEDGAHFHRADGDTEKAVGEAVRVESGMGAYTWFAVSKKKQKAKASGIYIVNESRDTVCFLPNNDADFAGTLRVSPNGMQFLLDFGTSPHRDLRLYDFLTLKEHRAFVAMETIAWIDPWRFVMTSIDDKKPARTDFSWMSAAVYDSSKGKLSLLKAATDTSDFMLDEADMDKKQLVITERHVASPADWSDDGKIQSREMREPFPAAN